MKKIGLSIIGGMLCGLLATAVAAPVLQPAVPVSNTQQNLQLQPPPPTTPTYTNAVNCTQVYPIPSEKLFYLTLASINNSNFTPIEAQTRAGVVLFSANNKLFLATVANIDNNSSMLKISPADNSYYFAPSIVNNLFYYITLNTEAKLTTVIKGK